MECERVREEVLALVLGGEGHPGPEVVARHLEGCDGCRAELEALQGTWALLGRWPEASPGSAIRARLVGAIRRRLLVESVLTVRGWVPAVLTAMIGVGLSLGLALLVPYSLLVSLCRQLLEVSGAHAAPYLLAGLAYGIPLALGVGVTRRRTRGGAVIGSLEASLLFLVILSPYVIIQCREFSPAFQIAFLSGLTAGALGSSLAALWLVQRGRVGQLST
ncbi:MAG: anti-sigma factor family protein [Candidatus Methylomirabilia bacterium]